MKKASFLFLFAIMAVTAVAQNIQVHYDLGHSLCKDLTNRPSLTTTLELFKPDKWGSTFTFTDIDVSRNKQWAAHVEYNGGLASDEDTWQANRFQHAVLLGGAWNWHSADFSKTFSVQALYKYYFKNRHYGAHPFSGFQLTEVWGITFAKGLCTFSGFCDVWYNPDVNGKLIVMSEPQGVNLSLGSEVELSNNFVWNKRGEHNRFYALPTLAAKWTF